MKTLKPRNARSICRMVFHAAFNANIHFYHLPFLRVEVCANCFCGRLNTANNLVVQCPFCLHEVIQI